MTFAGIAKNHVGCELKTDLLVDLSRNRYEVCDYRTGTRNPGDDFADYVTLLAQALITARFSEADRHLRRLVMVRALEGEKDD